MKIIKNIEVPTGNILVVEGENGKLECLSLGDYGKDINVKADFLGLQREPERVTHNKMLPLEEKWVITISSQYGCSMGCKFCDVPKAGAGINATRKDMVNQVKMGVSLHPEVTWTNRLNLHYARMGEPTFNWNVLESVYDIDDFLSERFNTYHFHPVVSTMMPKKNRRLRDYLLFWTNSIKNELQQGEAGLQLSINSTNEKERKWMFSGNALTLEEIGGITKQLPRPKGRKYTLNFAIADYEINPETLLKHFDPKDYICKLTPMHKTSTALDNDIKTEGDYTEIYPYLKDEQNLKEVGYDVLVFVASEYEDLGRITCGNALLGGSEIKVPHKIIVGAEQ